MLYILEVLRVTSLKWRCNKKVLLREPKRHTAHYIASTPSVVLSWEGVDHPQQGVPHPWPGGYTIPSQGVPHLCQGVPCTGVPLGKGPGTSQWGTPWKGHGNSGSIMGWRWGTPGCELTNKLKLLPSLILRMRAVMIGHSENLNSLLARKQWPYFTVADLGFPRGGCANAKRGRQPTICLIFPENCMKMKKFWLGGARPWRPPLDPPLNLRWKFSGISFMSNTELCFIPFGTEIRSAWTHHFNICEIRHR